MMVRMDKSRTNPPSRRAAVSSDHPWPCSHRFVKTLAARSLGNPALWLLLATALLFPNAALSADPDLSDVHDILGGQRTLLQADDVVVPNIVSNRDDNTPYYWTYLSVDEGLGTTATTTVLDPVDCKPADRTSPVFPATLARPYEGVNDVLVSISPSDSADATCAGEQNLVVAVTDPSASTNDTTLMVTADPRGLRVVTSDFDQDGYDDIAVLTASETFVLSAVDTSDPTQGLAASHPTSIPAARVPLNDPTVGDFNNDGNLDMAWVGADWPSLSTPGSHLFFATICVGPKVDTVCSDAESFDIIVDPASAQPVALNPYNFNPESGMCGGLKPDKYAGGFAVAGNFAGGFNVGDELIAVFLDGQYSVYKEGNVTISLFTFDEDMKPTLEDSHKRPHPACTLHGSGRASALLGPDAVSPELAVLNLQGTNVGWYAQNNTQPYPSIVVVDAFEIPIQVHLALKGFGDAPSGGEVAFGLWSAMEVANFSSLRDPPAEDTDSGFVPRVLLRTWTQGWDGISYSYTAKLREYVFTDVFTNDYTLKLATEIDLPIKETPWNFKTSEDLPPNDWGNLGPYSGGLTLGDIQGRSLLVGAPNVLRASSNQSATTILKMPPMFIDYVKVADQTTSSPDNPTKPGQADLVNFSGMPSFYRANMTTTVQDETQSESRNTTSYTAGTQTSLDTEVKFGPLKPFPPGYSVDLDWENSVGYSYQKNTGHQFDTFTGVEYDASHQTYWGDVLFTTSDRFNVYSYPVIGQVVCAGESDPVPPPEQDKKTGYIANGCKPLRPHNPNLAPQSAPEDCTDPLPLTFSYSSPDQIHAAWHTGTTQEWYQPVTMPGNIFSYPWSLTQLKDRLAHAGISNVHLLTPEVPQGYSTDSYGGESQAKWSEGSDTGSSSGASNTHSYDSNFSASYGKNELGKATGGFNVALKQSYSCSDGYSTLTKSTNVLGASQGVKIKKPELFLEPNLYQYTVEPFIFGVGNPPALDKLTLDTLIQTTGTLITAYTVDMTAKGNGLWWNSSPYAQNIDIGLNQPQLWNAGLVARHSSLNCLLATTNNINSDCISLNQPQPNDLWNSEFHSMRGLYIQKGDEDGPNGPQLSYFEEGDTVYLTANVYNFSLVDMTPDQSIRVRFYRQPWNETTGKPSGDSVLIKEEDGGQLPGFNSALTPNVPNWHQVGIKFDVTDDLLDTYQVFWVLVYAIDNDGGLVEEIPGHGLSWRHPGDLASINDVPLEHVSIHENVDTDDPITVKLSNNAAMMKLAVYFASSTGDSLGAASDLELDGLRVEPERVGVSEKTVIRAEVEAIGGPESGVKVTFYDGDPDDGGRAFDTEWLSHIREGDRHAVSAGFRPRTCGPREIFVVVAPSTAHETRSSVPLDVACIRSEAKWVSGSARESIREDNARMKLRAGFDLGRQIDLSRASIFFERILDDRGRELLTDKDGGPLGLIIAEPKSSSGGHQKRRYGEQKSGRRSVKSSGGHHGLRGVGTYRSWGRDALTKVTLYQRRDTARLDLTIKAGGLSIPDACTSGQQSSVKLTTQLRIEDDAGEPLHLFIEGDWDCPTHPGRSKLRVQSWGG